MKTCKNSTMGKEVLENKDNSMRSILKMVPLTVMMNIVTTMLMAKLKKKVYRRADKVLQPKFYDSTSSNTISECALNAV